VGISATKNARRVVVEAWYEGAVVVAFLVLRNLSTTKAAAAAAGLMTVVVVLATPPTLTDPGTNPPTRSSPSAPSTSKTSRTKAHPRTDRTGISSLVSGAGRARLPTLRLGYKEGWNENLMARYPVYMAWGDERWEMGEEKIAEEVWEEKMRAEEVW
jgi:hypothetical protein